MPCYHGFHDADRVGALPEPETGSEGEQKGQEKILIWNRCNPLKCPESDE